MGEGSPQEQKGEQTAKDAGDVMWNPKEGVGPGVNGVDRPPLDVGVEGALEYGVAEGGDEVGAGDKEEGQGEGGLPARPVKEVGSEELDGDEEAEAGPDGAGDKGLAGRDVSDLDDGRAEDVPEVVVVHGRGGAGEVEGIGGRDAGADYGVGEGDAVALVGGDDAEVELGAELKVDQHEENEGDPVEDKEGDEGFIAT